uniref:Cell cycle control protein 50A n=1 Tax=Pinguiococcus pyrenoidosus TaxID=172671 RepID=A0A7R9U6E4_9STRA|mmetsp:Transcript_16611/g.63152  ORF Transcript_16611/g.63152 Transcript_16611/m.63152 type:complete len:392 (+) Transcript_16611:117-1292(+)
MSAAAGTAEEVSRRPDDTDFKQQRLKAWQPILTPRWVIGTFLVVGIIFVPVGVVLKNLSDEVVEFKCQYDGEGAGNSSSCTIEPSCKISTEQLEALGDTAPDPCYITIDVDEKMEADVFVYYELHNFYQNHRRYVKSREDAQLRGEVFTSESDLQDCLPLVEKGDTVLSPCGLIANSLFNDVITLTNSDVEMREDDISWQSDRDAKFDQPDDFISERLRNTSASDKAQACIEQLESDVPDSQVSSIGFTVFEGEDWCFFYRNEDQITYLYEIYPEVINPVEGVNNEHFIVWMRTAGLPQFRKLYGRIEEDIPKGTQLRFQIVPRFIVEEFDGKKFIVVSTTTWFGGRNPFLGIAYIVVGSICLFLSLVFFVKHTVAPRKLGDTRYLVWKDQ